MPLFALAALLLIAPVANAQTGPTGTWQTNWVPVDANGNPNNTWGLLGTPEISATNTYPAQWNADYLPSYPYGPNIYSEPQDYGDGPQALSNAFDLDASATNAFFNRAIGNWELSSTAIGSVSVTGNGSYTLNLMWDPIFTGNNPGVPSGDYLTLKKEGELPTSPAVPSPPSPVHLLVTANEGGGASGTGGFTVGEPGVYPTGASGSSQISDSLGDGASYSNGVSGSAPYGHLVTATSGNPVVETVTVNGTATASDPDGTSVNYGTQGSASVGISYVAALDNRFVVLSRNSLDKIDPDETHEGDTIYSYEETTTGGNTQPVTVDVLNNESLTPVRPQGVWSSPDSVLGFSWSPNRKGDMVDAGSVQMGYGNISYLNGDAQGKHDNASTYNVSYTCTDPKDGAKATGKYIFHVHDQWDNMVPNPAKPTTSNNHYSYYSVNGVPQGAEDPYGAKTPITAGWSHTITDTITLGLNLNGSFKLSDALTFGIAFTPSYAVSSANTITVSSNPIDPGFESFPYIHTYWLTRNYLFDNYNVDGVIAGSVNGHWPQSVDDISTMTCTAGWSVESKIPN